MAKKPTTSQANEDTEKTSAPVKVLRIDDLSASIFRRDFQRRGENQTFFSVSFSRSYKDASGVWKYSKSFDLEDLGRIISLCQQADEYIRGELNEIEQAA